MNKHDLIKAIAEKVSIEQKTVQSVLSHFQTLVLQELSKEKSVVILEFGQFKVVKRSSRTGVNPQTKEKIQIPEKQVPKLVPSKKFKSFVEGSNKVSDFSY